MFVWFLTSLRFDSCSYSYRSFPYRIRKKAQKNRGKAALDHGCLLRYPSVRKFLSNGASKLGRRSAPNPLHANIPLCGYSLTDKHNNKLLSGLSAQTLYMKNIAWRRTPVNPILAGIGSFCGKTGKNRKKVVDKKLEMVYNNFA